MADTQRHLFKSQLLALKELETESQMIHGDVKPDNTVISDDASALKLIDFDLSMSKPAEGTSLRIFHRTGTDRYQAPEIQLVPEHGYDPEKAQTYALGAFLFTLVFQKFPFGKVLENDHAFQFVRRQDSIGFFRYFNVDESFDYEAIKLIWRCIQLDPESRPTLDELMQDNYVTD